MDFNRAKQIIESPNKIEVMYNGESVWIDGLIESDRTAQVHTEGSEGNRMQVPVTELSETHR